MMMTPSSFLGSLRLTTGSSEAPKATELDEHGFEGMVGVRVHQRSPGQLDEPLATQRSP